GLPAHHGAMSRPLVVLIGPPGAGKSRIGTTVAKRLGVRLIDTDRVIVKRHGPISDIFARDGEPRFRELERAVVHEALRGRLVEEGEDFVVALGGGAILDTDTQRELAGERVALITVTAESVLERLSNTKRPLLTGG